MKKSILAISSQKEMLKKIRKELSHLYEVITFNNFLDGLDILRESDFDLILLDQNIVPFTFVEMTRKLTGIDKDFIIIALINEENEEILGELKASNIYSYLVKPLLLKDFNKLISPAIEHLYTLKEKRSLKNKLSDVEDIKEIIGQSNKIKELKHSIDKISKSDFTVLISGENGVGKGLVATEIYNHSDRRKKSFLVLNCASTPSNILESGLFGGKKQMFSTLNYSKKGLLEKADGGTIFLDEITGLNIKTQSKLLKAIEYGEFKRVGETKTKKVNVRFIISTSKDLKTEVEQGRLRSDLYHRLTAFNIDIVPLRERKEDIPLLANYFLNKKALNLHKEMPIISSDAMKYLIEYSYPGNIRELKNIIERVVILTKEKVIEIKDIPLEIKIKSETVENQTVIGIGPLKDILEKEVYNLIDVEKIVIAAALQKTRWNKQETAKFLGIGRTTLYEKIKKYKLDQEG